jgi:glycosyltransferase involved in cell wall biosynthesis
MNRTYMRMMMPTFLRAADAVICISQSTLSDARARYPMIGSKGHVIYPGVSARFRPPQDRARLDASPAARALRARLGLPERFLLYVGTIEPRKNLAILFEALKQADLPDTKLVIAGKMGWLFRETVARVHDLGLEETVIFAGFVPDDDLPMLYSLAEAFVFPSLYEGFGLPVVEAMACGTPVLCTNVSSLPEVAGDAALMSAPGDVGAWAKALRRITEDPELRADLSRRGPRQAARFTWRDTAEQTRAVYQDLWVGHNIRRQERGLTPCA